MKSNPVIKIEYSNKEPASSRANYKKLDRIVDPGFPVDPMGYWNPANVGKIVQVPTDDGHITMKGVNQPLIGMDEHGNTQYQIPGQEYHYQGKFITEYPITKNGGWLDIAQDGKEVKLKNIKQLYNPLNERYTKLLEDPEAYKKNGEKNLLFLADWLMRVNDTEDLTERNPHPYTQQIKDMQLKLISTPNDELSNFIQNADLNQKGLGQLKNLPYIPKSWNKSDVFKYMNYFKQNKDKGYTYQDGGWLDTMQDGGINMSKVRMDFYPKSQIEAQQQLDDQTRYELAWLKQQEENKKKSIAEGVKKGIPKKQAEAIALSQENPRDQGEIKENIPQSKLSKFTEIVSNPVTAMEDYVRSGYNTLPDHFSSNLDRDMLSPTGIANMGYQFLTPMGRTSWAAQSADNADDAVKAGDYTGAAIDAAFALPGLGEGKKFAQTVNKLNRVKNINTIRKAKNAFTFNPEVLKAQQQALQEAKTLKGLPKGATALDNSTMDIAVNNTVKNLEDLNHAKDFAKKYGYKLPDNLDRISQSDQLTDKTIRGLMNRHNTFVRGVSTNWDEIEKRNPEILRHLEGKGFDLSTKDGTKAAAEYMATHVPIQTGYGRASLDKEVFKGGEDAIYTSNSIPTAEGYTYGQGFVTKVKKPTNFSSSNRKDWVDQNNLKYTDEDEFRKLNHFQTEFGDNMRDALSGKSTTLNYNDLSTAEKLDKLKKRFEVYKRQSDDPKWLKEIASDFDKLTNNIEDIGRSKYSDKLLRTERSTRPVDPFSFILSKEGNTKSITDFLKNEPYQQKLQEQLDLGETLGKYTWEEQQPIRQKLIKLREETNDMYNKSVQDYMKNNYPAYDPVDKYAHYIHLGAPGEKILEPVKSWEITPDIWKNKSRSHSNTYSRGLTAAGILPAIAGSATLQEEQDGGWLDDEEFRRGGQKGLKKFTSKNIATSVNDIMMRNVTLFGPAGKKRYKPGLKFKNGGGWLDNIV